MSKRPEWAKTARKLARKYKPRLGAGCVTMPDREPYAKDPIFNSYAQWWRPKEQRPTGWDELCDGVYVDASFTGEVGTLGFVRIAGGYIVEAFSLRANCSSNGKGELEAARLARTMFPGAAVYCDCQTTCKKLGITKIDRRVNPAHRVARRRIRLSLTRPPNPLKPVALRGSA